MVPDVSKDHGALIFRLKQFKNYFSWAADPDYEDSTVLQNVVNRSRSDETSCPRRPEVSLKPL
jgi:hypothetical protein